MDNRKPAAADLALIRSFHQERIEHTYTRKDAILYALGVGLGADPTDAIDLAYLYEEGLRVLPGFGGVLAYPGMWIKDQPQLGMDWKTVLNGEQGITLHRPIPPEGEVTGTLRVDRVVDKGRGKDLLVYTVREIRDRPTGELICTITNTVVCRKQGVQDAPPPAAGGAAAATVVPQRPPDHVYSQPILPQAGLLYRLSGDLNALHVDPKVAAAAGFPRPILQGAATWGMVAYGLMKVLCRGRDAGFRSYSARFTAPVYPGEVLNTDIWVVAPGEAVFRTSTGDARRVVLDAGRFAYSPGEESYAQ